MEKSNSFLKKNLRQLKKLLGLNGFGNSFKHYIDIDNAHAGMVISSIVMALELYMIFYVLFIAFFGAKSRSLLWIAQHLTAYIILFLGALSLFIFSLSIWQTAYLPFWWGLFLLNNKQVQQI